MTHLAASIDGVGLLGPGLVSWNAAGDVLAGRSAHAPSPTILPVAQRLPAAERRRAGTVIRLALGVTEQAVALCGWDVAKLATVFTSSSGEGSNCHALCEALASTERSVSPTRFTNSVHNAAAGYWHIAVASRAASTSVCGYDSSFGAGLVEAMVQVATRGAPVLLVATDTPYSEPLNAKRPLSDNFGIAFVLAPQPGSRTVGELRLSLAGTGAPLPATSCRQTTLEALRVSIPAAAGLPLLEALARREPKRVSLICPPGLRMQIDVSPPR